MLIVVVCAALLLVGVVLAVLWGGERLVPRTEDGVAAGAGFWRRHLGGARLALWWYGVLVIAGTVTSLLVTGAGGRLVMRLLAATSPDATYSFTEAGAVVGLITVEGTVGYVLFGAVPFAFASTLLYLIVAPWLPPGRWAGPTYGALLLVTLAPVLDPLRADNFDFLILGPGWVSVVAFSALTILQGTLVAAVVGRVSRSLPLMGPRNLLKTALPLLPVVVLWPYGVMLLPGLLITFAFPRLLPWGTRVCRSRPVVLAGRIVLGLVALAALPMFIGTAVTIWTR